MKKNPGRREARRIARKNRTSLRAKKAAINERKMLRLSKRRTADGNA